MNKTESLSAPVHWSKDFVEHLRTVHFALMAVATGLIVLVLSSKEYNAITALGELEEIIDLKRHWSPSWIEEHGDTEHPAGVEYWGASWKDGGFDGIVKIDKPYREALGTNSELEIECLFPKENWYHSPLDWSPTQFPNTLSEFTTLWENLDKTDHVLYLPREIQGAGDVGGMINLPKGAGQSSVALGRFARGVAVLPKLKVQFHLSPDPRETLDFSNIIPAYEGELQSNGGGWPTLVATAVLRVNIGELARYTIKQKSISRNYPNLRPGEFNDTFRDLASAADALRDLPLEDIKELLHDEAAKGPDVFEVFGMKFPAGQVALWGSVLLLSIQLYLLIYLRQLAGKLRPDDPGWDVPWIGIDSSDLAKTLSFVTLVPLPVAALVALTVRQIKLLALRVPFNQGLYWEEIALLLFACSASLCLATLCWKYRPHLVHMSHASASAGNIEKE